MAERVGNDVYDHETWNFSLPFEAFSNFKDVFDEFLPFYQK